THSCPHLLSLSLTQTHTHAHTHLLSQTHTQTHTHTLSEIQIQKKLYWHDHHVLQYCQSIWVGCIICDYVYKQYIHLYTRYIKRGKGEVGTIIQIHNNHHQGIKNNNKHE